MRTSMEKHWNDILTSAVRLCVCMCVFSFRDLPIETNAFEKATGQTFDNWVSRCYKKVLQSLYTERNQ